MSKQKIGAREAVKDIKSGMTDAELMEKYGLSPKGLASLFQKLVQARVLEESFVRQRISAAGAERAAKPVQSPAPPPEPAPLGPTAPSQLAEAVLQDIKAGRHDNEIMGTHRLSPGHLKQIKVTLAQAGLLAAPGGGLAGGIETRACPTCSHEVEASTTECPNCGRWLEPASPAGSSSAAPVDRPPLPDNAIITTQEGSERKYCVWEDRSNQGLFRAYFQTATKCLLNPSHFFSELPLDAGYWSPVRFCSLSLLVAAFFGSLWIQIFKGGFSVFELISVTFVLKATLCTLPLIILLLLLSLLIHGMLMLMKSAATGFQGTFRVVSYSSVTGVFSAIPIVGTLASLWGLYLAIVGIREVNDIRASKASAAVLAPFALVALVAILFGTGTYGSPGGRVPEAVCRAVEAYIARIDGAAGLESAALWAEFQTADSDLYSDLKPFMEQPGVHSLAGKAVRFGYVALMQQSTGAGNELLKDTVKSLDEQMRKEYGRGVDQQQLEEASKGADELREELRKELRKACKE